VRRVSTSGARENHPLFSDPEAFLHKSFDAKESLLDHFAEHNRFPGDSWTEPSENGRLVLGFLMGAMTSMFGSLWVLWKTSVLLLTTYLSILGILLVLCVLKVSWDETGHRVGNDYKTTPPSPGKSTPTKQTTDEAADGSVKSLASS